MDVQARTRKDSYISTYSLRKHSVAELPEATLPEAREAELPAALVQHVCAVDVQLCMFPDIESMKLCLLQAGARSHLADRTSTDYTPPHR